MSDQDSSIEPKSAREALVGVGDRLAVKVMTAWEDAGVGGDGRCTWPDDETRYALVLDSPDEPAGLDLFAAVLDETVRAPAQVALQIERGRGDDLRNDRQDALERLAANTQVTATEKHTAGTAPATAETFDNVMRLYGEGLTRAVVADENGEAIVDYRETAVVVSLPNEAVDGLRSALGEAVANRLEQRSD